MPRFEKIRNAELIKSTKQIRQILGVKVRTRIDFRIALLFRRFLRSDDVSKNGVWEAPGLSQSKFSLVQSLLLLRSVAWSRSLKLLCSLGRSSCHRIHIFTKLIQLQLRTEFNSYATTSTGEGQAVHGVKSWTGTLLNLNPGNRGKELGGEQT